MHENNYLVIVISNQSGISRGYYNIDDMNNVNNEIQTQLGKYDKRSMYDGFYYCPHSNKDNCNCRKPLSYLLEKAAK